MHYSMRKSAETKEERFKRLATTRVNEILKRIKTLGNLSNVNQYAYTENEVRKIFATIDKGLRSTKEKFNSAKNGGEFKL